MDVCAHSYWGRDGLDLEVTRRPPVNFRSPQFDAFSCVAGVFPFSMLQQFPSHTIATHQTNQHRLMNSNHDEAQSNYNDFNEILQSEVYVDLERLRMLARHGVPNELRGVSLIPYLGTIFPHHHHPRPLSCVCARWI